MFFFTQNKLEWKAMKEKNSERYICIESESVTRWTDH